MENIRKECKNKFTFINSSKCLLAMSTKLNRRNLLKQVLSGSAAMAAGLALPNQATAQLANLSNPPADAANLKGNINHSVCRWCYSDLSLEDLCKEVKRIGFNAIDL